MSSSEPSRGLGHVRRLALGNAASAYGSYLNMIALSLYAYEVTKSPLRTGIFLALRLAAGVAAGLIAGPATSRFNRKTIMMTADLLQACGLAVLLFAPTAATPVLLYGLAIVTGGCSTLSSVALRASIPEIAGPDQRLRANALLATGRSLAMVLGFASAGLVISTVGYTAAFAVDAATFLFSAANLAQLPLRTRSASTATDPDQPAAPPAGSRRFRTLRYLLGTPVLISMIAVRGVDGFGSASHNVGLPVLSTALDPAHPAAFVSQFWAVWALGNILAQRGIVRWNRRTGRQVGEREFAVGACLMSASFIAAFVAAPWISGVGIAIAVVAGAADGYTEIAYVSRLQVVPDDRLGHTFAASAMAENIAFGSGMIISAAILEGSSPVVVVTTFHSAAIMMALGFLILMVRRRARLLRSAPASVGGG